MKSTLLQKSCQSCQRGQYLAKLRRCRACCCQTNGILLWCVFRPLCWWWIEMHCIVILLRKSFAQSALLGIWQIACLSPCHRFLLCLPKRLHFLLFWGSLQKHLSLASPLGSRNRVLFLWCRIHCSSNKESKQSWLLCSVAYIGRGTQGIVWRALLHLQLLL